MGEEDSIEAAAASRRERLKALKAAQELLNTPDEDNNNSASKSPDTSPPPAAADDDEQPEIENPDHETADDDEANINMKFRNYLPHDKLLQDGRLAPPSLPKFEDPVLEAPPPEDKNEDPFLNIAPKKPNWDLRRDVQKRLDKLERKTQKAMLVLMEREEKRRSGENDAETEETVD